MRDRLWFYLSGRYNGYERFAAGRSVRRRHAGGHPPDAGQLQLHHQGHLAGVAGQQVPSVSGPTVQRGGLQQRQRPDRAGSRTAGVRRRLDAAGEVDEHADVQAAARRGDYSLHASVRSGLSGRGRAPRLAEFEQSTGKLTVATTNPYTSWTNNYGTAASASYVTGAHAIKTGMTSGWGTNSTTRSAHGEIQQLKFNTGDPLSVTVRNTPYRSCRR